MSQHFSSGFHLFKQFYYSNTIFYPDKENLTNIFSNR